MRNFVEDVTPETLSAPLVDKPPLYQETLLDLLGLSEATLRANRAGRLTPDQQNYVRGQMKTENDGLQLLTSIFVGTALLLVMIFFLENLPMAPYLWGGGIFGAAFAFYMYRRNARMKRDMQEKVLSVTDQLRLVKADKVNQWAIVIGSMFFPVSQAMAERLDDYALPTVQAYYASGTKTLLSLDVVSTGADKRKNDDMTISGETLEEPLAAWDKPKNRLTDETPAAPDPSPAPTPEETATKEGTGGRRF